MLEQQQPLLISDDVQIVLEQNQGQIPGMFTKENEQSPLTTKEKKKPLLI